MGKKAPGERGFRGPPFTSVTEGLFLYTHIHHATGMCYVLTIFSNFTGQHQHEANKQKCVYTVTKMQQLNLKMRFRN